MNSDIRQLLESVKAGATSVEEALLELKKAPFEDIGYAKVTSTARYGRGQRKSSTVRAKRRSKLQESWVLC